MFNRYFLSNDISRFINSEIKLRDSICSILKEKNYIVFKSKKWRNFRLGNGIIIINNNDKFLINWVKIFDKYFNRSEYLHKTFMFVNNTELENIKQEAIKFNYNEVNVFPILIRKSIPIVKNDININYNISKIDSKNDWILYKNFLSEIHSDNLWLLNEGFYILKEMSKKQNIERFYIKDVIMNKIISVIGIINCGNIVRIENVETHPDFRRKSLAFNLIRYSLLYSIKNYNINEFILTSANDIAADRLYKKLGFEVIGEKVELLKY